MAQRMMPISGNDPVTAGSAFFKAGAAAALPAVVLAPTVRFGARDFACAPGADGAAETKGEGEGAETAAMAATCAARRFTKSST